MTADKGRASGLRYIQKARGFRAFREVAGARFVSRYHRPRIREVNREPS